MDIKTYIEETARRAKQASIGLRGVSAETKNRALLAIARLLGERNAAIKEANRRDLARGTAARLPRAFLDRLELTDKRIAEMADSVRSIAAQEDPVGAITGVRRPPGFVLQKVRIPIGVVAMIYESRPNVTVDAAALCCKSGNAVILRGGSEAADSSTFLASLIREGIAEAGLAPDAVQYIARQEHEGVSWLVKQTGLVDLVVPRGGESLIRRIVEAATVPVIKHYKGVCHLYVDESADLDMAARVVANAKVQRPATCNALETLLVHASVADRFLPMARAAMPAVELRGCERTRAILSGIPPATEEDWYAEYLDLILAVRVVDSLEEAIGHIERYGSSHTDGIISRSVERVERFVAAVDSAVVTVNASTRLADGGVFGLGAEIGISTDKLHARGPMGLEELTTYKWVVRGNGDIRT